MKKTSETIVFFGNERLATGVSTSAPTLRALIKAGYQVAAVVSNYEQPHSRSERTLEIVEVAKEYNIPSLLPKKLSEIKEQLRGFNATAGVLVAYGRIVPQSVIDLFPRGIVNIHPSLLPLHRGPTPIESVILEGAQKTGVSLMQLAKEMDAGPVYKQITIKLTGEETKQQLADTLLGHGKNMLLECLPSILDDTLPPVVQDNSRATYDNLLTKEAGVINWRKSATQLEREIRAFLEWPKSRTTLARKDIIITKAHAEPSQLPGANPGDTKVIKEDGVIMVATGDGALCVERLKPAGKQEMSARDFIAGYGSKL